MTPPKPQPWYASLNQPPRSPKDGRNRKPNPSTHRRPADGADHSTRANDTADAFTFSEPAPPAIPYAGIRAGELTGHRMWLVVENQRLCSLAHHFIWEPNAVIEGDVNKRIGGLWNLMFIPRFGGVYSYFTAEQVQKELHCQNMAELQFPYACVLGDSMIPCILHGIAYGTIKCWGEVIEHEHGYRAQYAKLTSIDGALGQVDLPALRSKYHV